MRKAMSLSVPTEISDKLEAKATATTTKEGKTLGG